MFLRSEIIMYLKIVHNHGFLLVIPNTIRRVRAAGRTLIVVSSSVSESKSPRNTCSRKRKPKNRAEQNRRTQSSKSGRDSPPSRRPLSPTAELVHRPHEGQTSPRSTDGTQPLLRVKFADSRSVARRRGAHSYKNISGVKISARYRSISRCERNRLTS